MQAEQSVRARTWDKNHLHSRSRVFELQLPHSCLRSGGRAGGRGCSAPQGYQLATGRVFAGGRGGQSAPHGSELCMFRHYCRHTSFAWRAAASSRLVMSDIDFCPCSL